MNWEAIGAIGEILGALTVVFTVVYLAFQVRYARFTVEETKKLSQVNISDSTFLSAQQARSMSIANEEVASISRRGMAGEKLDDDDEYRFTLICEDQYYYFQNNWNNSHILGTTDYVIWEEMCVQVIKRSPGFERIWLDLSSEGGFLTSSFKETTGFGPPFITAVRARLEQSGGT